jgi:hypothetical protein
MTCDSAKIENWHRCGRLFRLRAKILRRKPSDSEKIPSTELELECVALTDSIPGRHIPLLQVRLAENRTVWEPRNPKVDSIRSRLRAVMGPASEFEGLGACPECKGILAREAIRPGRFHCRYGDTYIRPIRRRSYLWLVLRCAESSLL